MQVDPPTFLSDLCTSPEGRVPFAEAVSSLAQYLTQANRSHWDEATPAENRDWYLTRSTGLRAYSHYEAKLMLKPYERRGWLTADGYVEALVRRDIKENGTEGFSCRSYDMFSWPEFLDYKRQHDPDFYQRLGQWLWKKQDMDSPGPAPRIKLYCAMYDRAAFMPLEFCTDEYAAFLMNALQDSPAWPHPSEDTTPDKVRGWRRLVDLRLSRPYVVRLDRSSNQTLLRADVAKTLGIPLPTA